MTNPYVPSHDFEIEADPKRKMVFYTPLSHLAYEWAVDKLEGVVRFGRSFVLSSDNIRSQKLKGFLIGRGFTVKDSRGKRAKVSA